MLKKVLERVAVYADWSILALCSGAAFVGGMNIVYKAIDFFDEKKKKEKKEEA